MMPNFKLIYVLNNLQTTSRQIHILFEQSSALQVLYKVDKHKNTKQPLLFMYVSQQKTILP